jgi:regulator of sigma E protease
MVSGQAPMPYLQVVAVTSNDDQLAGPIRIAMAHAAEPGYKRFMREAASYSITLFLVNLLPIPIGDGGNLLWCAIELVGKRPVSGRTRAISFYIALVIGVILLLGTMQNLSHLFGFD